jgi:outer membrane protein OmpU
MKKVLFATTALVAFAGAAAADITYTGTAGAGVAQQDNAAFDVYSFAEIDVKMSGSTDSGLTFGATIDLDAGVQYDTGDWEWDNGQAPQSAVGLGEVFVSGAFGTITFDRDGIDNLVSDDYNDADAADGMDVRYNGTFGGFTVAVAGDVNEHNGTDDGADWAISLGYTVAGVKLAAAYDELENGLLSASYTTNGFTIGYKYDDDNTDDMVVTNTLSVGYTTGAYTLSAEVDDQDGWAVGVAYAANGMKLGLSLGDNEEYVVTGSYDLGGGLTAVAGVNEDTDAYVGVAMSF